MRRVLALVLVLGCGSSRPSHTVPAPPPTGLESAPVTVKAEPVVPAGPVAPVAERQDHAITAPGGTRNDPYYWLRDDTRKDAKVLAYLEAETVYTKEVLAPVQGLEDTLFAEMRGRIKENDSSVPELDEGYWYYVRYETGKQYPIYARKKGTLTAPEQIMLDGNQLSAGKSFYRIGDYAVSRDGKLVAYAEDTVGRNQFTLRVKNLVTGETLPDTAENIAPAIAWANDNKTLFYTGKDATTLREDRIYRHVLGGTHDVAFQEPDGAYYVSIEPTKSKQYVQITLEATTNTEVRLIDANKPTATPRVFLPRSADHIYNIDHLGKRFVMRTNEGAKNFRLVEVSLDKASDRKAWKEILPHRADALVESFALYDSFVAASVRTGGLRKIQVVPAKGAAYFLDAQEPTYAMNLDDTPDHAATKVRYGYDAMTTPSSVYEVDIKTKARTLLKQQEVPTYDASAYTSEYLYATASDGTQIPISVVYRKDVKHDGRAPLLVYGYGSYGISTEPRFDPARVSLLDRGFVYAIAHIRGGQEMGRAWYEDGKLMKKMNTFTDFIAATEYLVKEGYGARDQVFAMGGSAGGLLMGAVANLRPDLYRGMLAMVPFVDVVTSMLDESIPLTTNEFDEWGNPKEKAAYDYMLAYSPYDQIKAQAYPALYVRTGLWDSQVQYFEPAKWVAKLRATKTDTNPLVFDINMSAGHGGASGRFDRLREAARAYAFVMLVKDRPDSRAARN